MDGVIHPRKPQFRRAVQLVCFVHRMWHPDFGGNFAFCRPDGTAAMEIEPQPGRLLAFESGHDLAYHAVCPIAEDADDRVTVACSLLAPVRATDTRQKALFMPRRG